MRSHVPSSHHLCFSKLTSDALRESRTIRPPFRSKKPSRDLDLDAIWEFLSPVTLSMILLNLVFELGGALPSIAPIVGFFKGCSIAPMLCGESHAFQCFPCPICGFLRFGTMSMQLQPGTNQTHLPHVCPDSGPCRVHHVTSAALAVGGSTNRRLFLCRRNRLRNLRSCKAKASASLSRQVRVEAIK